MPQLGSSNNLKPNAQKRCRFPKEFEDEAVQMLLDGHSATSIAASLRLSGPNLLYRWKRELIGQASKTAETLEDRVCELEAEPRRVRQERYPESADQSVSPKPLAWSHGLLIQPMIK